MKKKPRWPKKKNLLSRKIFLILWTLFRVLAVVLLWWNPAMGLVINVVADGIDGDILERLHIRRRWYEDWDKWLDLWFYGAVMLYVIQSFPQNLQFRLLAGLFVWRLTGHLMFYFFQKEWLLFIFPNFFTVLFSFRVFFPQFVDNHLLFTLFLVFLWGIFKEWWIHIARIDLTNLLSGRQKLWQ